MIHRRKLDLQKRFLRVLTLVVFFNFSGLNNGFTYFVISSGQVQRVEFAPLLVERAASVLNPLTWQSRFIRPILSSFNRSHQVIQFASRRAVQNLLLESSLLQSWMSESCLKILNSPHSGEISARSSADAKASIIEKDSVSSSRIVTVLESARNEVWFAELSKYNLNGSKKTWIMNPSQTWKGQKGPGSGAFGVRRMDIQISGLKGPGISCRLRMHSKNVQDKLRMWLSSSLSRGGNDVALKTIVLHGFLRITLPDLPQGDFLFAGGRL